MALTQETLQWLIELGFETPKSPLFFTSLAIIATIFLYFYTPYWSVRKVPGPPTTPLLGHLPLFAKYGLEVFSILAKRYGPIFRFHMGRQPLVIIADPELCKEIGIKKFKTFQNRSIPSPIAASLLHQKGLFFTRDTRWTTMRNAITSIYQPTHLSTQLPLMKSVIELLTANLPSSEEEDVNFSDLSLKMATDSIGLSAFGIDFGLTTVKMDLSASFSIIIGLLFPILQEPFRQILKRLPWTTDWKIEQTNQKLTRRLDEIVAKRLNDRGDEIQSKDFLTLILNTREVEKGAKDIFTPDFISALTYEHLIAGSATTSFTLSSILYLVSAHPEVEKKLVREIDEFGPRDLIPTAHDLQHKFPYLNQVIKEAMRYYTMSPLIAREASRKVEIGGYVLPKGTWVWLAPGVMAKHSKLFPEPDMFKPERFDPSCDEQKQRHRYANIPFGIGPRACIGMRFALLTVVHLYQRFVFRHSPNMEKPLALEYGIVLEFKHGVKLRVIKRM
ncbi:hypothetical protein ACHQM5_029693 [Ranunculus cassubicifolius]